LPSLATCPHCGAQFKASRLACPECGSDAETGWQSSEQIDYMSIDLPEEEAPPRRGPTSPAMLYLAAILAILAMVVFLLVR